MQKKSFDFSMDQALIFPVGTLKFTEAERIIASFK
jgi:hypothetical protein